MKQDEFIREFNEYFIADVSHQMVTPNDRYTLSGFELLSFINHLLSKQKPSEVSEEINFLFTELRRDKISFAQFEDRIKSLSPLPSNEAVEFAEWLETDSKAWDAKNAKGYTTQELFTLYKEGEKK